MTSIEIIEGVTDAGQEDRAQRVFGMISAEFVQEGSGSQGPDLPVSQNPWICVASRVTGECFVW